MTSELTVPELREEPSNETASESTRIVEHPHLRGSGRVTLSVVATSSEAAAVAAALTAHLAAGEESAESTPDVDRWKLADRTGSRRTARFPVDCTHGDAWKLAGRSRSW